MQNHYRINVSKKDEKPDWRGKPAYSHFFATSENSCVTEQNAREVYAALKLAFPSPEYQVEVTKWEARGRTVSFKDKPSPYAEWVRDVAWPAFAPQHELTCDYDQATEEQLGVLAAWIAAGCGKDLKK